MANESKYHFAREVIFNLKSCHAISEKVYLHWVDKLNKDEIEGGGKLLEKISFETEYALQEFRERQESYFDEEGKAYRSGFSFEEAERMLKLINLLEADLKK